ncbi:fatty acid desaturase-domain-containing protein [Xylaria bambusicola]|uniref:fatty acid desaturase-domain-containing protein n=1 Tax=Xylaria bambusicola TaxID=326684 RepID=UPI0020088DEB|nr:fatty acid desaturase-domain-containing protein [Xylaria bambusicola]KAI0523637.1 fatty acid desaturase-domain-containing protein [Xylaria bambusicola]
MSYVTETIHGEVEITTPGDVKLDIKTLRDQIPAHCLKPSTLRSLSFVVRDAAVFVGLLYGAFWVDKNSNPYVSTFTRYVAYPYAAGIAMTGLWVLAHEAGHGAFSTNKTVADTVGFLIHSALMSPYFAWRSSHARHHQFANNVSIDLNYVPPSREEYRTMFGGRSHPEKVVKEKSHGEHDHDMHDNFEDAPLVVFWRIVLQQVIGWHWYLLSHITAGPDSGDLSPKKSRGWWDNSHFMPNSSLFRTDEFWDILLSDVGLLAMMGLVYNLGKVYGFTTMLWTYILPLMWVNHWIVMITYLHHTHTSLPKYTPESWTYLRGALATVDRDPGFIMRHMTHHIIDLHVVHHLFPRVPHYHAQEATDAMKPLLGEYYHSDKTSYWGALWNAFTQCQWVEPDAEKTLKANVYGSGKGDDAAEIARRKAVDEQGVLWYRSGRMPLPVVRMRRSDHLSV